MKLERVKKLILGAAAAAAATGVIAAAAAEYQAGWDFTPVASDHALNENQVVFPEGDKTADRQQDHSGDSELWQKDANADDNSSPQNNDNADYLFESSKTVDPNASDNAYLNDQTSDAEPSGTGQENSGPTTVNTVSRSHEDQTGSANTIYDLTKDASKADLILSGSGNGGSGTGNGNGSSTAAANPSPSSQPAASATPHPVTSPRPTAVPQPTAAAPTAQPTAAPTSTPAPTRKPAPTADDPDSTKVMPGIGGSAFINHPYDESTVSGTPEQNRRVRFNISYTQENSFYSGQKIDQRTIYNALETYVMVDRTDIYAWGADDYDKYVRVVAVSFDSGKTWSGKFPMTIPNGLEEGQMQIKVEYRFSTGDAWKESIVGCEENHNEFAVEDSRVLVLNAPLADDAKTIDSSVILTGLYSQYPKLDSKYNLFYFQDNYLPEGSLTELFPGWTEYGLPVSWFYPVEYGRHVLEPAAGVPLDTASYRVEKKRYWMTDEYEVITDPYSTVKTSLTYLQTLTLYTGSDCETQEDGADYVERLTVPQYVQAVDMPHYPYLNVDYLDLPDTVLYVDGSGVKDITDDDVLYDRGLQVTKGYTVADGNPRYTAENGLLYNKDKTEILGIPTSLTELTVPADISKVVIPYRSSLKSVTLQADSLDALPEINYRQMPRGSVLSMPDALLDDYLMQQRTTLQSIHLHVAAVENPARRYTVREDYAVTDDGMLHLVLTDAARWLSLPEYVTGLEQDALQNLGNLTTLRLPENGSTVTFEPGWADGADNLQMIACYSQNQYEAALAAAPKGVEVTLMGEKVQGYTYMREADGSILLLAVPRDITSFDGTVPAVDGGSLAVTAIGDGAFKNCDALEWVSLPEETSAIGYQAFKGCSALQGVLIGTTDTITMEKEAFDQCPSLRFIASNAANGDIRDEDFALTTSNGNSTLYAPTCAESSYTAHWIAFDEATNLTSYEMVDCGGTKVLYGCTDDSPWLLLRSGGSIQGEVSLPMGTIEIFSDAMEGARAADGTYFSVDWDSLFGLGYIDSCAFANSDLGADVTLPYNLQLATGAFMGCTKMTSLDVPGWNIVLGDAVFNGCTSLQQVSFGHLYYNISVNAGIFNSCSSLTDITFVDTTPPRMSLYGYGMPFRFNANDWNDDASEEAHLHIHVPEGSETDYLQSWRYAFVGYIADDTTSAYQLMWRDVYNEMFDYVNWVAPSINDVNAEVDRRLLVAENHTRRLLGMPDSGEVTRKYSYVTDELGYMTLTAARGLTYTDLTPEELELPEGWFIDYIGTDAFRESPELRTVMMPETLSGIYMNAFRGVTFDEADDDPWGWNTVLYLYYASEQPYELLGFEDGTPFSFGVPDDKIVLCDNTINGAEDAYIQAWTLPMTGYHTVSALRAAVTAELDAQYGQDAVTSEQITDEMTARLLVGENRVRAMLHSRDTITDASEMVFDMAKAEAEEDKDTDGEDREVTEQPDPADIETPETAASDSPDETAPDAESAAAQSAETTREVTAQPTAEGPKETLPPATPETAAAEG